MAEHRATFKERFSEIFETLEECGHQPKWQHVAGRETWPRDRPKGRFISQSRPPYDGRVEIVACGSGPIKAVALAWRHADNSTDLDSPPDWEIFTEVCFQIRADWANRWIPGLHLLSVHLKRDNQWIGNDLGLGLMRRLDSDLRSAVSPSMKIRVRPPYDYHAGGHPILDIHHVADHEIEIVGPENSNAEYDGEKSTLPASAWLIPHQSTIPGLISVGQILIGEPPHLPSRTKPPAVSKMPARGINYPILAGYLLLTLLLVIGGLASIFWDWPGGRTDRAVFLAIVLFLISSYLCVKSYKRLKMIRSGFAKIAGTIDRKWTSPDHGRDGWQGNASFFKFRYAIYDTLSEDMLYFIRVEGLPFVIAESQHRELFEGDSVTITYWPGDKRVESIERRTTSTMVD